MAKITATMRDTFDDKAKSYRALVDKIFDQERKTLDALQANDEHIGYQKLALADLMLYVSSVYLLIHNLSVAILQVKNEEALNEGRKALYKAIIYLEEVVGSVVDAPFSDYEDKLEAIAGTTIDKRYYLVRKMGLAIDLIVNAYGDNTKWKWSFVELGGRFAVVAKNLFDMKEGAKILFDPQQECYDDTFYYMRLIKTLLSQYADRYRDRYELSTKRTDDIRMGINFLLALRRIHILLGESDEAEDAKRKALVWKEKMVSDTKKGIANK